MERKTTDIFLKNELLCGFVVLDRMWKRNLLPWNLERHYFLYWFVVYQGNIVHAAEAMGIHRNTIQFNFVRFGFAAKTIRLRRLWEKLADQNPKASFESNFFKFYHSYNAPHQLSSGENKALIRLWQTGFSFKTLGAHYMLWALRNHKSREWFERKLGYSDRHCQRILVSCLNPKTTNGYWLLPLKPTGDEIYTKRYLTRQQAKPPKRWMAVSA